MTPEQRAAQREVFEAARRAVGLREGCTYDALVEGLDRLRAENAALKEREQTWAGGIQGQERVIEALREAGEGLVERLYNHPGNGNLCWCEGDDEAIARWREAAGSGAGVSGRPGAKGNAQPAPETLAGVPVDDLYKPL